MASVAVHRTVEREFDGAACDAQQSGVAVVRGLKGDLKSQAVVEGLGSGKGRQWVGLVRLVLPCF